MPSPIQPGSPTPKVRTAPCVEGIEEHVSRLVGHPVMVVGCAESASRKTGEEAPNQIIVGWYTDDSGQEHFYIAEMWPPDYHVGTIELDIVWH